MLAVTVSRVVDGDTVHVRAVDGDGALVKVRLQGIDAPELAQAYGTQARNELALLLADAQQQVAMVVHGTDRYRRTLGTLYAASVNVNLQMIRRGAAWHYVQYFDSAEYAAVEAEARAKRAGLWSSTPAAVAPWEWRRERRQRNARLRALSCETCGQLAEYTELGRQTAFCGVECAALHWGVSPRQVEKQALAGAPQ